MHAVPNDHPLRRLFAGLTEHTFMTEIGVADMPMVDYLTELLTRFLHRDAIHALGDRRGDPREELAALAVEAERTDLAGDIRREIFRHIGDYALFWTGVYPEALAARRQGGLGAYAEQGKRCYFIASTYTDTRDQQEEAPVLRRISSQFDLCAYGLRQVRRQWEHATPPSI